jgi:hypothetical protein
MIAPGESDDLLNNHFVEGQVRFHSLSLQQR